MDHEEEDLVNNPPHYRQYDHEVIELTEQFSGNVANTLKYILRARFKGKFSEDLRKSAWYLRRAVSHGELAPGFAYIGDSVLKTYRLAESYDNEYATEVVRVFLDPAEADLVNIADIERHLLGSAAAGRFLALEEAVPPFNPEENVVAGLEARKQEATSCSGVVTRR